MRTRRITAEDIKHSLVNISQITFEVTDACNLKCKYCGYGDLYFGYDKREDKFLDYSYVKVLLDYFSHLWNNNKADSARPTTYISFYGGEPLLNMKLIEQVVKYIEKLEVNRKFIFSMTTNAMLLDKCMEYLVSKDFKLLISLDGDETAHSYRVTHNGKNSFDKVFSNVKKLQKKHPSYFAKHVNFNAVLHNRSSVDSVHHFIKNEFGKLPTIAELNNSGIRPEKIEEFNRTYQNKHDSLLETENYEKISEEMFISEPNTNDLLRYLHSYSGNVFGNYNDLFIDKHSINIIPTGTCSPFSKKIFVTVNGKILQCEKIDHDFSLGNITENEVMLDLERIALDFNTLLDKLQPQCNVCYRAQSCTQCLFYIEDIRDSISKCNGFMGKREFILYSSHCLRHLAKKPNLYKKLMQDVVIR
ncbi:MAG: radical SAM peptide maturase [Bacteroidales bacterium]